MAPELNDIYNCCNELNQSSHLSESAFTTITPNNLQINQSLISSNLSSSAAVDIYAFGMVALEVINLINNYGYIN